MATPGGRRVADGEGTPTSAANITRATVANNTITDFRAGVGVEVSAGNLEHLSSAGNAAPDTTNVIVVTGNSMNGGNADRQQRDRFFPVACPGTAVGQRPDREQRDGREPDPE